MKLKVTWLAMLFITLVNAVWASPSMGDAQRYGKQSARMQGRTGTVERRVDRSQPVREVPQAVSFRVVRDRGLLVNTWVNGEGPYKFAIDTGAGGTIISGRLAVALGISTQAGRHVSLSGMSGREAATGRVALITSFALGEPANRLPANRNVVVSDGLPSDIDGILDPTEAYFPFGYTIDLPHRSISSFDCAINPVTTRNPPAEGAVVRWLTNGASRRPFVRLEDGRQALLDTGSGLGLALSEYATTHDERSTRSVRDIGGGSVSARRVEPTTVSIGALTLRRIPTDVVSGAARGTPVLLGRDALAPFRLSFDPIHRLIAIGPG